MEEYFFHATGGDGSRFVAITDPGSKLAGAGRGARLPADVPEPPRHRRPVLGALATSASCPPRSPASRSAPILDRAARRARARPGPGAGPADNAPLQLGALLGDSVAQGRDKLTIIADAGARAVRPLARAADRRVDRQGGHRRRAAGRRADRRRPTVYGDDRALRLPARSTARTTRRSPPSRPPASTSSAATLADLARHRRADAHVGARDRLLRRAAAHQPVRPAERRRPRRTTWCAALDGYVGDGRARVGRRRRPVRGAARRRARAARSSSIQAYVTPTAANEARAAGGCAGSCATRSASPPSWASAPATCTRPASCTRAARGRASTCRCWPDPTPTPRSPGRPYGFRDGDRGAEPRRRAGAARDRPAGGPRRPRPTSPPTVDAALGAA